MPIHECFSARNLGLIEVRIQYSTSSNLISSISFLLCFTAHDQIPVHYDRDGLLIAEYGRFNVHVLSRNCDQDQSIVIVQEPHYESKMSNSVAMKNTNTG